jgi:hypothetical protein
VGDHEPAHFARTDPADEFPQAPLVIIEPGSQVAEDLKPPAVGRTKSLQQLHLSLQIRFLVVTGDPGVGQGDSLFGFRLFTGPSAKAS